MYASASTLLFMWFAFAPPSVARGQAEDEFEAEFEIPQIITEFDAAFEALGAPDTVAAETTLALERAIDKLELHARWIDDDLAMQARLSEARLALAWLHLSEGEALAAEQAMDEAIRSARGRAVPAGKFGPDLIRLYDDRVLALEDRGRATIDVDCGHVPCQVIINEWRSAIPTDPLYLGSYRVWIGPHTGASKWEFHEIFLSETGASARIEFAGGVLPPAPEVDWRPIDRQPDVRRESPPSAADVAQDDIKTGWMLLGVGVLFDIGVVVGIVRALEPNSLFGADFWTVSAVAHGVVAVALAVPGGIKLGKGYGARRKLRPVALDTGRLTPLMLPRGAGLGLTLRI